MVISLLYQQHARHDARIAWFVGLALGTLASRYSRPTGTPLAQSCTPIKISRIQSC